MISLRTHNMIDYLAGFLVALSPFALGMADIPAARHALMSLGLAHIVYSLLTNYRFSIGKMIPLRLHMAMDATGVVLVMCAPFIFGYGSRLNGFQIFFHFIFAITFWIIVVISRRTERKEGVLVAINHKRPLL